MNKLTKIKKYLDKKLKKGFTGYPVGTIAFYGPNDQVATKVSVGIILDEGMEPEFMQKWHSQSDLRRDEHIMAEVIHFIRTHQVRSVTMLDRIIGCPHEEGMDYEGDWCPQCPFWKNRDRWTGEKLH